MKISMSSFLDFVSKSGAPKTTVVKVAKDPSTPYDYWMPLKNGIANLQSTGGDPDSLDEILNGIPQDRLANFQVCIDAFKKWHKGRAFGPWKPRPARVWKSGELEVSVVPDLHQSIDGIDRLTKLYFSAPAFTPARAIAALHLIGTTAPACGIPTVLEVRKGKIHEFKPEVLSAQEALLQGEAETFVRIWKALP
jgi:hypothetical protein